jgi:hypothetical protein
MPRNFEIKIKKRGLKYWRTLKLPNGEYEKCAIVRKAGKRGGHTVCEEPRMGKRMRM